MLRTPRETDAQKAFRLRSEELNGAMFAPAKPGFFAERREQRMNEVLSASVENLELALEESLPLRG